MSERSVLQVETYLLWLIPRLQRFLSPVNASETKYRKAVLKTHQTNLHAVGVRFV